MILPIYPFSSASTYLDLGGIIYTKTVLIINGIKATSLIGFFYFKASFMSPPSFLPPESCSSKRGFIEQPLFFKICMTQKEWLSPGPT